MPLGRNREVDSLPLRPRSATGPLTQRKLPNASMAESADAGVHASFGARSEPGSILTRGEANGLLWRGMSPGERRMFVTGIKYGARAGPFLL